MLLSSASTLKDKLENSIYRAQSQQVGQQVQSLKQKTGKGKENGTEEFSSNQVQEKKQRKQSLSTIGKSSDSGEESNKDSDLNCLDITFSNFTTTKASNSNKSKRFSHQSPHAIILYSLLYNHFTLESVGDELPNISAINNKFITSLKVILRDWTLTPALNSIRSSFSPQSLLSLISSSDETIQQKLIPLKAMIGQMSGYEAQRILRTLTEHLKSGKQKARSEKVLKSYVQLSSAVSQEGQMEMQLNEFGWLFGITLKLYKSSGKSKIGAFNSCVTLGLKDEGDHIYSLKNIACFQSEN